MKFITSGASLVGLTLVIVGAVASCTVEEPPGDELSGGSAGKASGAGGSGNPSGSGSGAATSVGGSAAGTSPLTGAGGVLSMGGTEGISGAAGAGFKDCEADVSEAVGVGLDMYILFDRSGSMAEPEVMDDITGDCPIDLVNAPAEATKWCLATNALARFFTTPTTRDVRAALQFMSPAGTDNDTLDLCGAVAGNPHATAAVELTQLPVDASHDLVTLLDADAPQRQNGGNFGTRIEGALNGIAMYTAANLAPPRRTIGVLITDGNPHNCSEEVDDLAQIAADHFMTNDVATFIIGMTGADAANLEVIAQNAGGPAHGPDYCDPADATCHYWTVGDGDPAAFSAVLEAIQDSVVIPCEYTVPIPSGNQMIDPALVAVTFDNGSGMTSRIAKVDSELACDPVVGGWYFDNPMAPTAVRLCPTTCEGVGVAVSGAAVQLRYGCVEDVE